MFFISLFYFFEKLERIYFQILEYSTKLQWNKKKTFFLQNIPTIVDLSFLIQKSKTTLPYSFHS